MTLDFAMKFLLRYEVVTYATFMLLLFPFLIYSLTLRVQESAMENKYTREVNFLRKGTKIILYLLAAMVVVFTLLPLFRSSNMGLGAVIVVLFRFYFIIGVLGIAFLVRTFLLFYVLRKLEKNGEPRGEVFLNFGRRIKTTKLALVVISFFALLLLVGNASIIFPYNRFNGAFHMIYDGDVPTEIEIPPGLKEIPLDEL